MNSTLKPQLKALTTQIDHYLRMLDQIDAQLGSVCDYHPDNRLAQRRRMIHQEIIRLDGIRTMIGIGKITTESAIPTLQELNSFVHQLSTPYEKLTA